MLWFVRYFTLGAGRTGLGGPKAIYSNVLLNDEVNLAGTAAYPGNLFAYPTPAANAILIKYFTLLDTPAISGLAPQIPWDLLNPNDPGPDPIPPDGGCLCLESAR